MDLPEVSECFETSRKGVYIVGELGGMGLIKNAIRQGLQLSDHLSELFGGKKSAGTACDVAIVGAGCAGLAVALCAEEGGGELSPAGAGHGRRHHRPLPAPEAGDDRGGGPALHRQVRPPSRSRRRSCSPAGTGRSRRPGWPSRPAPRSSASTATTAPSWWRPTRARCARARWCWRSAAAARRARSGVPGDEPRQGRPTGWSTPASTRAGGCWWWAAATRRSRRRFSWPTRPTPRCRSATASPNFGKAREANKKRFKELVDSGRLFAFMGSQVKEVGAKHVVLEQDGKAMQLPNDYVIACLGGELPSEFLKANGVELKRFMGEQMGGKGSRRGSALVDAEVRSAAAACRRFCSASARSSWRRWRWWATTTTTCRSRSGRTTRRHRFLKPSGLWGHGVGIVATAFMLSNFLYAVRKRWTATQGQGLDSPLAHLPPVRRLHEPAGDRLPRRLPVQQPAGQLTTALAGDRGGHRHHRPLHLRRWCRARTARRSSARRAARALGEAEVRAPRRRCRT